MACTMSRVIEASGISTPSSLPRAVRQPTSVPAKPESRLSIICVKICNPLPVLISYDGNAIEIGFRFFFSAGFAYFHSFILPKYIRMLKRLSAARDCLGPNDESIPALAACETMPW
jgi:hypothetical protein